MMPEKFLVVGGDGAIGSAIAHFLARNGDTVRFTSRRVSPAPAFLPLDLSSPDFCVDSHPQLRAFLEDEPPLVFFAAAVTGFAQCASDPVSSRMVNVLGTCSVAGELMRRGAFVVFPSSNAVFSGKCAAPTESSSPDPVSEYGTQKAEAEAQLLALADSLKCGGLAVVRLTKVLSSGPGLVGRWIAELRAGHPIQAAHNLSLAPLSLSFVAEQLVRLAQARQAGILHLSGEKGLSYLAFAQLLCRTLARPLDLVSPIEVRGESGVVAAPVHSVLDMVQTTRRTGVRPQEWLDVVKDLLELDARDNQG